MMFEKPIRAHPRDTTRTSIASNSTLSIRTLPYENPNIIQAIVGQQFVLLRHGRLLQTEAPALEWHPGEAGVLSRRSEQYRELLNFLLVFTAHIHQFVGSRSGDFLNS
jgi:hypothetical protein